MPACPHPPERQRHLFAAADYITGHRFAVERCDNCAIAFSRPRPNRADMAKYYPPAYYGGGQNRFPEAVKWLQRFLYSRRALALERLLGAKGRVLDVGCGPGFLLREFQQRGWEVQGTEFSEHAAAHAQNVLRLPVFVGDLVDLRLPPGGFDVVIMWHVLEHLLDPHAAIAESARLLRPGGILLCAVPNFGSPEARFTRDKWFHLDVPRHLNHFTAPALANLLLTHEFTIRHQSFFAVEYDAFSFTQSALNALRLRHNLLYNLLRGAGAKVLGKPTWLEQALSLFLAAPLGLLSVPLTTFAGLTARGATVTFYAQRSRHAV